LGTSVMSLKPYTTAISRKDISELEPEVKVAKLN
jgi:hypothetical protein